MLHSRQYLWLIAECDSPLNGLGLQSWLVAAVGGAISLLLDLDMPGSIFLADSRIKIYFGMS
jgi:hypothetical protein